MVNAAKVASAHVAKMLMDRAKDHFGITNDFSKGAWLLPSGELLNFGKEGGRLDHSDIAAIFPEEQKKQDLEHYVPEKDFIRNKFLSAGAIRLVAEGGGIEITSEPTSHQMSKISEFLKWLPHREFFIDLSGKGQPFRQMYDNDPDGRSKVLDTIERYFKGQMRSVSEIQQYRYSDESRRHIEQC